MIETYASYVWACYAITIAVLALLLWFGKRRHADELLAVRRRQQMKAEDAV